MKWNRFDTEPRMPGELSLVSLFMRPGYAKFEWKYSTTRNWKVSSVKIHEICKYWDTINLWKRSKFNNIWPISLSILCPEHWNVSPLIGKHRSPRRPTIQIKNVANRRYQGRSMREKPTILYCVAKLISDRTNRNFPKSPTPKNEK